MRLRWLGLANLAGSLALASWAVRNHEGRARTARLLEIARQDMAAVRYATARLRLGELAQSHCFQDEIDYQFGLCEQARGKLHAAPDAWQRVDLSSPFTMTGPDEKPVALLHCAQGDDHG